MSRALHLVAVVTAGVLAGIVSGIWLIEVSIGGAADLWIDYHQAIRGAYTLVVPPLGALALVTTAAALLTPGHARAARRLLVAAAVCLVLGMVVTLGFQFPLNARIAIWLLAGTAAGRGAGIGGPLHDPAARVSQTPA